MIDGKILNRLNEERKIIDKSSLKKEHFKRLIKKKIKVIDFKEITKIKKAILKIFDDDCFTKNCYNNALILQQLSKYGLNINYVEGYISNNFIKKCTKKIGINKGFVCKGLLHAWNTIDGKHFDVTNDLFLKDNKLQYTVLYKYSSNEIESMEGKNKILPIVRTNPDFLFLKE